MEMVGVLRTLNIRSRKGLVVLRSDVCIDCVRVYKMNGLSVVIVEIEKYKKVSCVFLRWVITAGLMALTGNVV